MKYVGVLKNIFPILPYSARRQIHIKTNYGLDVYLRTDWPFLDEQLKKGITIGDEISIDYKDFENFHIEKEV